METALPTNLLEAIQFFAEFENCRAFLSDLRWPNGKVSCPQCGSEHVAYLAKDRRWKCYGKHPKAKFTLKTGTIFEDSPLPLDKWLVALWLIVNCKNGVSSCEIARHLGITQKSAWFMAHRLRLALHQGSFDKLSGSVEIDETYIGGKSRNMHPAKRQRVLAGHKGGHAGKTIVLGMLERGKDQQSTVRTQIVGGVKRHHLIPTIEANVEKLTTVYTDALPSYEKLPEDFMHHVINHAEKYAEGQVHVNGMENFWSLLKRCIGGTYVSVETFHLFRYLDEQVYRFNNRKEMTEFGRFALAASQIVGRRLTWKQLVGEQEDGSAILH
jgi:transposase-like protein